MAHKFNPKNKEKLMNKERKKNLPPYEILREAGLQPGQTVIDIGCGVGYFSLPAAEIVGPNGEVYALDTVREMTDYLKAELEKNKVQNVKVLNSTEYGFPIKEDLGDYLLMSMVLHEVEEKTEFLQEAYRTLKNSGKIVLIEWQKKETEEGPPLKHRIGPEQAKSYLKQVGFQKLEVVDLNRFFYMVVGEV